MKKIEDCVILSAEEQEIVKQAHLIILEILENAKRNDLWLPQIMRTIPNKEIENTCKTLIALSALGGVIVDEKKDYSTEKTIYS